MKGVRRVFRWALTGTAVAVTTLLMAASSPRIRPPTCPSIPVRFILASDVYKYLTEEGTLVPRYASLVKDALAEPGSAVFHVLAGDFLMPTLYGVLFEGEPIIRIWDALEIDAAVPGNHEFDLSADVLEKAIRNSPFPWVCTNCEDSRTGQPYAGMSSYLLLERNGIRVGFFGIISPRLQSVFRKAAHPNLKLTDPIDAAASATKKLRDAGACLVIALTHQDTTEDKWLAEVVPEISLILGGHTHTVQTTVAGSTLIFRTGYNLQYFGMAEVILGNEPHIRFTTLPVTPNIPEDPEMKGLLQEFEGRIGEVLDGEWARVPTAQDLRTPVVRTGGSRFPNAVADILRKATRADIVFLNAGMFRGDRVFPSGRWPLRYLYEILPFQNRLVVLEVTGEILLSALEWGLQRIPESFGGFPVLSGVEVIFDPGAPPLHRVKDVLVGGEPLQKEKSYAVMVTDFLRSGGDGYHMFTTLPQSPAHPQEMDIVALLVEFGRSRLPVPLRSSQVYQLQKSHSRDGSV